MSADGFSTAGDPPAPPETSFADRHIGLRLRQRRLELGLSQEELGQRIAISGQQLHKYEHGQHRISAGRLYELATNLRVPVSWFFEGIGSALPPGLSATQRRARDVVRNFLAIENDSQCEALVEMARALAAQAASVGK